MAINFLVMPTKLANLSAKGRKSNVSQKQREKGLLFRVFYHHLFLVYSFFYFILMKEDKDSLQKSCICTGIVLVKVLLSFCLTGYLIESEKQR